MLTVTETAGAHLAQILSQSEAPQAEGVVVRMFNGPNGLGLTLDQSRPEDTTFDHDGETVLAMDSELANALDEKTLDVANSEQGRSLTIRSAPRKNCLVRHTCLPGSTNFIESRRRNETGHGRIEAGNYRS